MKTIVPQLESAKRILYKLLSLLLLTGKQYSTAFRANISASHIKWTTLAKHENDCPQLESAKRILDKLCRYCFYRSKQYAQRFVQSFQQATLNEQLS